MSAVIKRAFSWGLSKRRRMLTWFGVTGSGWDFACGVCSQGVAGVGAWCLAWVGERDTTIPSIDRLCIELIQHHEDQAMKPLRASQFSRLAITACVAGAHLLAGLEGERASERLHNVTSRLDLSKIWRNHSNKLQVGHIQRRALCPGMEDRQGVTKNDVCMNTSSLTHHKSQSCDYETWF